MKILQIILLMMFSSLLWAQNKIQWVEIGQSTYNIGFDYPYKIQLFVPYGVRNIDEIKEGLIPMKFDLTWLPLSLPQKKVQNIFIKQLKKHYPDEEAFRLSKNFINSFIKKLPATKKHDKWTLIHFPDRGSKLYIFDELIHQLVGAELNRALIHSWINDTPVLTANLFSRLLKLK